MEENIVKEFESENFIVTSVSELFNNNQSFSIGFIGLSSEEYIKGAEGKLVKYLKTDYIHPLVLENQGSFLALYIDKKWYFDNQNIIDELLKYIAFKSTIEEFWVFDSCLISDLLIDSICSNPNFRQISLGGYYDGKYSLKYSDYLKFKKTNIELVSTFQVDKELEEIFDPIIGYSHSKKLIGGYDYNDLINKKTISICLSNNLTDNEIENLKYVSSSIEIKLTDDAQKSYKKISNKLRALNKSNKIILIIDDKVNFNNFIFKNISNDENIFVQIRNRIIPLKEYLSFEKILYQAIEPAKNLSPFEKIVYAYNITKQFKEYKENSDNKSLSRNLYDVLSSEYIVCVGFSNLFCDLLNKLDIPNVELKFKVDTSYDNYSVEEVIPEDFENSYSKHMRIYVYIKDDKYGIDGFYSSDPTWDNDLKNDYYNHLVITNEEETNSAYDFFYDELSVYELFNINSVEEFYRKINFMLNRDKRIKLNYIIKELIELIYSMDIEYINFLKSKYKNIENVDNPKDLSDLISDLGEYILSRVNKPISGNTIMKAIEEVYRNAYGYSDEELPNVLGYVREQNEKRHEIAFPQKYKISQNGEKVLISDIKNKFEKESITRKAI